MKNILYLLLPLLLIAVSCSDDDDISYPKIRVEFASDKIGIDENNASADITINLSRKASYSIDVKVKLEQNGVVYGTDFTTNPIAENNTIKVTIPAESSSASIKLTKVKQIFDGTETVKFTIVDITDETDLVIGSKKEATLSFGTIISEGQEKLVLNGKTEESNYANLVYVDFSTNTALPVDRKSWILGFYSGKEFRVIQNSGNSVTSTPTEKTDITKVTLADAEACKINIAAGGMADAIDPTAIDKTDGSLAGTAFSEVSANESENKVYFVTGSNDKESRSQWYKVKVNRKGEGYSVQYAKVGATDIKTIEIAKNAEYNIVGLDFASGKVVNGEPKAKKWDIMWGYNTGVSAMNSGDVVAFSQDNVLINNLGGVEVAKVLVADIAYDKLTNSDISKLKFSSDRSVIGTGWRKVAGMGSDAGVIHTHYYVVKDAEGNLYKLKFLRFGVNSDGAERGRPEIQYNLIK